MKRFQGTVTRPIQFVGVGLHSGSLVSLELFPQAPNSGIRFKRTDIPNFEPVLASPRTISSTILSTSIGIDSQSIGTIEHLMAAFFGLGIDNVLVHVSSGEIPILDGSSAPFVDKLSEAGIQIQHVPRNLIAFDHSFEISEWDKFIRYEPPTNKENPHLEVFCSVEFPSAAIGKQSLEFRFVEESFLKICEARTFCHINSVNLMRSQGLALGGSLDNAVVVDDEKVLNRDGLRFPDEFVRHKVLDFIGDIALLPGTLTGKVTLCKNGHALHAKFTNAIMNLLEQKLRGHELWKGEELACPEHVR